MDYAGSLLLAAGTGTLMFVLVMAGNLPGALAVALSAIAAVLIAALVVHELRTPEPMMPLRMFRIRVIGVANAANFAIGALAMGITAFLPTFVQGAMGLSAVLAGATLGATSAAWTVGALIASRALAFMTFRATALSGGVMLVAGSGLLIMLHPSSGIWLAIAGASVIGFGFGFANLVFVVTTQAAVGWEQRGAVTASNLFMRQLGQAIGTAAFGAVFNLGLYSRIPDASDIVTKMMDPETRTLIPAFDVQRYAAAIAASLHAIYLIAAALAFTVLLLTLALPSKHRAGDPTPP
jgi:hypothetical protein